MPLSKVLAQSKISTTDITKIYETPNGGIKPEITQLIITKLNDNAITYSVFINTDVATDSKAIYYNIPTQARVYTIREVFNQPLGIGIKGNSISVQCSEANAITVTLFGVVYNV